MDLQIGNKLHGFNITRITPLEELSAQLIQMKHEKTELELLWMKREEENKTFAITFETLPWDDTGVFHILEHSVLCGSDKFPVKEPFVELLKNSMNTFLNAMTFPDKTMYPVSSQNNQDFINLMRVYLDAVFHPDIYKNPAIFMQEGWHYEKDEQGNVSYKGVVFNEMKGALADAGEIMEVALNRAMLPDTPYAYISGGDPVSIPNLTYEDFINAHKKFYSPTNGIIFLDGSIDVDQVLTIINDEFLADLPKGERVAPPQFQKPVDGGTQTVKYEIGPDEPIEERMRMSWGRGLGHYDEREKLIAMDILAEVLAGNNQAYLSKVILENGLAEDVILRSYDGIAQPWVKLEVRNFKAENSEKIEKILFDEISRLVEEGLDHDKLDAIMAAQEFLMGERDYGTYPQGLFFSFLIMDSMLYGGAPEMHLEKKDLFKNLRRKMEEGYFEELLREVMLNNDHKCKVILEPSTTLGEERRAQEEKKIADQVGAWDEARHAQLDQEQAMLLEWQSSEDSPEDLAKLPHLTLEDMDREPEYIATEVTKLEGAQLAYHPMETGDIRYINLYFQIDKFDAETLSQLSFLAELMGTIHTGTYEADQLIMMEQKYLGRLDYDLLVYGQNNSKDISSIQFVVTFSVLKDNIDKAVQLIGDVLTNTRFDQEQLILDILKQCKQERIQSFIMGGNSAALRRVMSMMGSPGVAQEYVTGHEYYKWLCDKLDNWNHEEMAKLMSESLARIVNTKNLTISVSSGKDSDPEYIANKINNKIHNDNVLYNADLYGEVLNRQLEDDLKPTGFSKQGIIIPADISFAVRGGDLTAHSSGFSGDMQVAARIISLAYLWNTIRVQGGAYGTGMTVHPSGLLACYSYRDPNSAGSLEAFMECGKFLREMAQEDFDLEGFIIGAVSDSSPLMTPRLKAQVADSFFFRSISFEQRCAIRNQLLSVTKEDLVGLADAIEKTLEDGGFCIVGSEEQLAAAGDLDVTLKL